MINFFFLFFSIILNSQEKSTQSFSVSVPSITVVYPWEGKNVGEVSKTFIFGNVKPYVSTITVNGLSVKVYKNGSFISYLAPTNGVFNITAANEIGVSSYTRTVVMGKDQTSQKPIFELVSPSTSTEMVSGNDIQLSVKGFKSATVYYEIEDICSGYMDEFPSGSGVYNSVCYVGRDVKNNKYHLTLKYKTGDHKGDKIKYEDFLTVVSNDYLVETSTDSVVLKNDIGGYVAFLPKDVILLSDRKEGGKYRVKLGKSRFWVDSDKVNFKGFSKKPLIAETGAVRFSRISSNKTAAKIAIYNKVPFSVWQEDSKLYLNLYNANLRTNWIVYDSSDNFVDSLSFRQAGTDEALFVFSFKKNSEFWGYDIYYSTDNSLNVELKFRPNIITLMPDFLKGLNIILDPGHSPKKTPPFDGGVGPSGSFEYEINLKIAQKLREKLAALGANVFMTRYSNDEKEQVSLQERPRIAKRLNGDLYISIHNNAIPDGEDPYLKPRGFQIYYYHLHSKRLAQSIHKSFLKNINLPDEGLRYGDYHVARITQMPSVLIENAYMILPEQEELLLDDLFCDKLAETVKEGIIDYFKQ
ncbi:MAG: N-acetylmuramoyl-L-alanine amidase [Elusimicrobiales bacterium]